MCMSEFCRRRESEDRGVGVGGGRQNLYANFDGKRLDRF